ncbi:MAG TPA: hypothetical protein VGE12_03005 [Noviherbaspirillum sp.]
MPNNATPELSLSEKRIRHVFSMRIAAVLAAFFTASTFLLQWALATEQFFMRDGVTRQFVQLEATICAVIAVCALLHLAASGVAWLTVVLRMRRPAIKSTARRAGALV